MSKILFPEVMFEERSHQYFNRLDGTIYTSCTTIIKRFTPPFPEAIILKKKAEQLGISQIELKTSWRLAADIGKYTGTCCHSFIENLFRNKIIDPTTVVPEEFKQDVSERFNNLRPMLEQFVEDHLHLEITLQEGVLQMGNLAGQIDMLTKNEDGTYTIWDFKSNRKLNSYSTKFLNELSHMKATDLNKFQLQMSLYQRMLEEINYVIKDRKIVHFCLENESYSIIDLPYSKQEAELLINYNYN